MITMISMSFFVLFLNVELSFCCSVSKLPSIESAVVLEAAQPNIFVYTDC